MHHIVRAVATCAMAITVVAGCDDAPLTAPPNDGPRAGPRAPVPAPASKLIGPIYTGPASDSLLASVAARWAAAGRPEYADKLRQVRATRLTVLRSMLPTTSGLQPIDEYRQARILTHDSYVFYGGQLTPYTSVNSFVAGEMTFIGDVGTINTSFRIVGNNIDYGPISGELSNGAGELLNCADIVFTSCTTHRLTGSMTLFNAPTCGVHAQGATTFQAWYAPAQIGISAGGISIGPGGTKQGLASAAQDVSTAAPQCPGPIKPEEEDSTSGSGTAGAGDTGAGGDMLGGQDGTGGGGYFVSGTDCWANYELMRVSMDPYEWYEWQYMNTECGPVTGWVPMDRAPSSGLEGPLFSLGVASPNGPERRGIAPSPPPGHRVILAASTGIPKGGRAAFIERARGSLPDVVLVDLTQATIRDVAAALSLGASRQGRARPGDRAYVVADDRDTRYSTQARTVIQQSLASLADAPVIDVPGFGRLPGVEIVLPALNRGP